MEDKCSNKELRADETREFYVISVLKDGVRKYVASKKYGWENTIKLGTAMRFFSDKTAFGYVASNTDLISPEVHKVKYSLSVMDTVTDFN